VGFAEELARYEPAEVAAWIEATTPSQAARALAAEQVHLEEFAALLSPAAGAFLESLAARAHRMTVQRFGRNIFLYAPLYLSNVCTNSCAYCGFNVGNTIPRRTLGLAEAEAEARLLRGQGFRHVLLLTGEAPGVVDEEYLEAAVRRVRPLFDSVSLEVYPLGEAGYRRMAAAGVDGLTAYQETYHRDRYAALHPAGPKRDFGFRLATPERAGAAGLRRIGVGALLGLAAFRSDAFFTGLHAAYLARHCWRSQVSVSFPRLRPAAGCFEPAEVVSDRQLVQLICAMRLWLPDAGLVLSTRESAALRDNLLPLGITQMSAGSCTAPGGYSDGSHEGEQFAIDDDRTPAQVARRIAAQGYEAVWKDWDRGFLGGASPA
jgi:2-iminoacetate synthase